MDELDQGVLVCDALGDPIASLGARLGDEVTVCVGPEGGLTDAERDALSAAGAVLALPSAGGGAATARLHGAVG